MVLLLHVPIGTMSKMLPLRREGYCTINEDNCNRNSLLGEQQVWDDCARISDLVPRLLDGIGITNAISSFQNADTLLLHVSLQEIHTLERKPMTSHKT